jgi:uncharacterized membrane protein YfcA
MIPHLATWRWVLGAVTAFLVGVGKTGAPGVATIIVPLMVISVGDARAAAAWTVPILSTADIFAVWYWRRSAEAKTLFKLVPWVVVGMAGGAAALSLSEPIIRKIVASIVLIMLLIGLWRRIRTVKAVEGRSATYGVVAGFASTVANGAGPVMNLYLLSKRLPKETFVATGAWFFFVINLAKVPIYASYHLFSRESLTFDLMMAPAVIAGAMAGRWVVRNTPQSVFDIGVLVLTAVAALLLFR